ncbi:MAG: 2-oxoglutarate dehydrogenase, E2 component, dihydrolipoamide succinyltransferase [Actinomycetaceae bacterium]|nr:2-oxoglutarate dehydrogenase, E2 component, dihydrolipoamide succinyltransferase [Actinomycetaceae bacterium]MDU0969585.1 2-oxoglutarate dehydrogenase, E2 component, dihydrolipoamide succinyltransferase [Actinomycetaceae bacterium]
MSTNVEMPALGESVTEGTISQWLVEVGDEVEADQPIVEVATDKVDSEVPAPVAGTILELCFEEDETVDVGTVICKIGDASEAGSSDSGDSAPKDEAPATPAEEAEPEAPAEEEKKDEPEDLPAAPPVPPLPGESIPSSVATEDGHSVVSWAYPQVGTGYPGTQQASGQAAPAAPAAPAPQAAQSDDSSSEPVGDGGFYVTPLVRKLAKDKGVDLSQVKGTGQGGRIRKQDVLDAAEKAQAAPAETAPAAPAAQAAAPAAKGPASPIEEDTTLRGKTEKMSRMRQVIADRMMQSLSSTAQLTTVVEVDVTRIASLRARAKDSFYEREGTKLSFLPFFVKAATEALKAHPKINSRIEDKQVTYFAEEHVGIAVDTERGLMVPVIKNAGDLTIAGIAKKINELAEETRTGKIDPSKLTGSTFTITNTGSRGALFDTPVINYPEEAILGLGTIVKRPAVIKDADGNDSIAIRSMCYLALSYDHRLIDGADAARYLTTVKKRLEDGDFAAELGL